MLMADVTRGLSRMVAFLVTMLAAIYYIRQLRHTYPEITPLPIFQNLLHRFDEEGSLDRVVLLDGADAIDIEDYVQTAVRKGENCIILGAGATAADNGENAEDHLTPPSLALSYPRWVLGSWELPFGRRSLTTDQDPHFFCHSDFIFETSWFGRSMFHIRSRDEGEALITDIAEILRLRSYPKARAGATLNLIWAHDGLPPDHLLQDLGLLVSRTNCRLVIANNGTDPDDLPLVIDRQYAFNG